MRKLIAMLMVLTMSVSAIGAISVGFVDVTGPNTPAGYQSWDMMVTTDTDWTNAKISIALSQGAFYNDAMGANTESNPAFFAMVPALEYDTYAATPGGFDRAASFTPDPVVMDAAEFTAGWFDSAVDGEGTFKIARMTVSADAASAPFELKVYDVETAGLGVVSAWYVQDGEFIPVPEPATMGLVLMGLVGLIRRK